MIALTISTLRNCTPGKRENMLGFKRVCRVCVDRVHQVCRVCVQSALHMYSKFFEGGRHAFIFRYLPGFLFPSFPLSRFSPGPAFSWFPAFPGFPGSRFPLVFVLTVGHMAGNRPGGPRSKEARLYSIYLQIQISVLFV